MTNGLISPMSDATRLMMHGLARLILAIAIGLSFYAPNLHAQETKKLPHIGVLWPGDVKIWNDALFNALRELGYVDGVTARVDIRNTYEQFHLSPKLAEELVSLNPDVIFAAPGAFAKDISQASETAHKKIPIVVLTYDPVAEGLVTSAAHPGGNITGVGGTYDKAIVGKHLQLLRDMIPRATRVAYLYDTTWTKGPNYPRLIKDGLDQNARRLGISVATIEINAGDQLEQAFERATHLRAEAIIVSHSPLFNAPPNRARIIKLAAQHRLPAIYFDELFAYDGGLMSYWTSVKERHVSAARLVAKILHGAKPSNLPIEYPTRIRLVVNLRTAKALGLTIPESVLIQADEVIR